MGKNDILELINTFSVSERLELVAEIIKAIREEEGEKEPESGTPQILELAGILNEEEAGEMEEAVQESRKVDLDGW